MMTVVQTTYRVAESRPQDYLGLFKNNGICMVYYGDLRVKRIERNEQSVRQAIPFDVKAVRDASFRLVHSV